MNSCDTRVNSWRLAKCLSSKKIPGYLRAELLDPSSTTKRFRQLGGVTFSVQVLAQGWEKVLLSERSLLKLRERNKALVREVLIYCSGQPWMFARCVFPATTLTGKNKFFQHVLDERPLGDLLYREPSLRRSEFELSLLQARKCKFAKENVLPFLFEPLWARRSIFFLHTKPILLTEVFLPALVDYCKQQGSSLQGDKKLINSITA